MYEVLRWIALAILWACIAFNVWVIFRNARLIKQLRAERERLSAQLRFLSGKPPVIFCYECEYFDKATINDKGYLICPASGMDITGHDYCSYAERKHSA